MTVPITVHALRRDGFAGRDRAGAEGRSAPASRSAGGLMPAGQDQVRLTLTVPPQLPGEPVSLSAGRPRDH